MNLNGTFEIFITAASAATINSTPTIPLYENSAIIYISVAKSFTLGSSLCIGDCAG